MPKPSTAKLASMSWKSESTENKNLKTRITF